MIFLLEIESIENAMRKPATEGQLGWGQEQRRAVTYACPERNDTPFARSAVFKEGELAC